MSLFPELDNLNLPELIENFERTLPSGEDGLFLDEIASRIQQQGQAGIDYLIRRIKDADWMRLRAILSGLTFKRNLEAPIPLTSEDRDKVKDIYLAFLKDRRSSIVADAIHGLTTLEEDDALTPIIKLREHSSPYVRGAVLHYVANVHPEIAYPLLLQGLKDKHHIVREWAADELGEMHDEDALPYLHPLLNDPNPDVREAAQTAIQFIEGTY